MPKLNLTDGQRVILAGAAARDSGLVLPVPTSMAGNRGTLSVILSSLVKRGLLIERAAGASEEIWREVPDAGRTTLLVSRDGLIAIGIDPAERALFSTSPEDEQPSDAGIGTNIAAPKRSASQEASGGKSLPRAGSKLALLIEALKSSAGATLVELTAATGWQSHSVRGAISGALKKKLGIKITSEVDEGRGRVYRIAADQVQQ